MSEDRTHYQAGESQTPLLTAEQRAAGDPGIHQMFHLETAVTDRDNAAILQAIKDAEQRGRVAGLTAAQEIVVRHCVPAEQDDNAEIANTASISRIVLVVGIQNAILELMVAEEKR